MSRSRWGRVVVLGLASGASLWVGSRVEAQGCVASRMEPGAGHTLDREGQAYFLPKSKWQASFGYRAYRSHRHFVGSVEQNAENVAKGTAERDRSGSEVINHVYIPSFGVTRSFSDRFNLTADLPIFTAVRRSPGNATRPSFATDSRGIGDLIVTARYWVGNPSTHGDQNLSFGVGIKAPTGNDRAEDDFLVRIDRTTGARITDRRPVDQSVQPGDGGWGFTTEFQAFKSFGKVSAFASGMYLFNPREQNDFLRDPSAVNPDPNTKYLSISDQFAARAGLGTTVKGIGVSLSGRLEGVPSSDLIGGDLGRRRPGYSIAIEPSVSYSFGKQALSLSVPWLVHRVRTQSYSDKLASERTGEHVNGDAAFADYVVIFGFSTRF